MRLLLFIAVLLLSSPAFAQDAEPAAEPKAETVGEMVEAAKPPPPADMGDLQRRVELATKMHEFRPAREQVDNAVATIALKVAPDKRELFKIGMRNVLNYKAIEKVSIDAMAETFTEKELEAMVEYYSKPEARSVSDKYYLYQEKVSPEIVKMLDKAMMQVKTGAPGQ